MTPELRQLRSFVAVAEAGSFTRAAAGLHIAQQSLSQQMRTLELQLGVTLFERSARGTTLTGVGEVLLREARPVLAQADRAVEAVRRAARGEQGELRVGFLSSVANFVMPPLVRAFRDRHPGIALHTEELAIATLVAGLREGRLDAALSRPPLVDDLATELVLHEPVAAVLPDGHPLASRETLTLGRPGGRAVGADAARVVAAVAPPVRRRLRRGRLPAARRRARDDPAAPAGAASPPASG